MKRLPIALLLMLLPLLIPAVGKSYKKNLVIAYVTSGSRSMPDPEYVTHINYAFGVVNKEHNGVVVHNPGRLKQITGLKKQYPELKVLLSIGGWGAGGFSEMVSDLRNRKDFCRNCLEVVKEFNLDGIDIDWEYPGSGAAGISHAPTDKANFTLLMKDLRATLGKDRLVTLATASGGGYYDFPAFIDYVDFVNMMTYDMGRAPRHHAPLYNSERFRGGSCEKGMKAHIAQGVPPEKLTLGVPFYGRGNQETGDFRNYSQIVTMKQYREMWDKDARVPYLADKDGNPVMGYDNPRSLKKKCKFIKKNHLLGIMYWQYDADDENGTLRKTLWKALK